MARPRKKKSRTGRQARRNGKRFTFQLGPAGIAGIAVVCFCLFLWMFLLGIWAGQTILLPAADQAGPVSARGRQDREERLPIRELHPQGRKRPVHANGSSR